MFRTLISFFLSFAIILPISVCAQSNTDMKIKTVVIDAGHGGKDPGTISKSGKTYEKTITLSVALRLGKLIEDNHPDVKVIYTRSTDVYVTLNGRAEIANKNKADLFISIHVNGVSSSSARGIETFVMGAEKTANNWQACLKENSVISLEEDFSSKYSGFDPNNPESYIIFSLLQNSHLEQSLELASKVQNSLIKTPNSKSRGVKQGPFLVLWKCTMPSILIELGFITNSTDLRYLANKASQQKMAQSIFDAFSSYKKEYDQNNTIKNTIMEPSNIYTIQIMASPVNLPHNSKEFKGLNACWSKKVNNINKYLYEKFKTYSEAKAALPSVKEKFPSAFIIKID